MKMMKAICTATVLVLTLSVSAFAGDISTPGTANPGGSSDTTILPTLSTDASVRLSETDAYADILLALVTMF